MDITEKVWNWDPARLLSSRSPFQKAGGQSLSPAYPLPPGVPWTCGTGPGAGCRVWDSQLISPLCLGSLAAPPTFTETPPQYIEAKEGGSVTMTCTAFGNPKPIVTWLKEGTLLGASNKYQVSVGLSRAAAPPPGCPPPPVLPPIHHCGGAGGAGGGRVTGRYL